MRSSPDTEGEGSTREDLKTAPFSELGRWQVTTKGAKGTISGITVWSDNASHVGTCKYKFKRVDTTNPNLFCGCGTCAPTRLLVAPVCSPVLSSLPVTTSGDRNIILLVVGLAFLALDASHARAANELCGQTFTQSVVVTADQACSGNGLLVGADGLTIDLGGFTISGDGGPDDGIVTNGHSVTIQNGTVRGFFNGIANDSGTRPALVKVSRVTARENLQHGALLVADNVLVEKSSFIGNGNASGAGLSVLCNAGKITASAFVGNRTDGLSFLSSANVTVAKIVSAGNGGRGVRLSTSSGIVIQSSTLAHNVLEGIAVEGFGATGVKITKNTIVGNGDTGVVFDRVADSTIAKNLVMGNGGLGVSVDDNSPRNAIVGNRVLGNRGNGIGVFVGATETLVKGNTLLANGTHGVAVVSPTTTLAKNVAKGNRHHAFVVATVAVDGGGNTARGNGDDEQCSAAIACPPPFSPKPGPVIPTCGMHVTASITLGADTPLCDTNGMIVDADNLTIDLNGHQVLGTQEAGTTGILVGDHDKITIKNGGVHGFEIGIASSFGRGLKIQNVEARSHIVSGATLGGSGIAVSKSLFAESFGSGLFFFDATTAPKVSDSFFVGNGGAGIVSRAPGSVLKNLTAVENGGSGIQLEGAGNGVVSASLVALNLQDGIRLGGTFAPAKLAKNVALANGIDGISLVTSATGLTIASNVSGGNGQHGIHIGPSTTNVVAKNRLLGNGSDGILVEANALASQLAANEATGNGNRGLAVSTSSSTLTKNAARANLAIGITAAPGTIDGGGNVARDNAGVAQCTNVVCD